MRVRNSNKAPDKIEQQMAPMIDVVFQLLIFFMLTLKIVGPEGDFNINMPINATAPTQANPDIDLPPMKVRLEAGEDGRLVRMLLNELPLGVQGGTFNPEVAIVHLNEQIKNQLYAGGQRIPGTEDREVEIDADYELNYEYTIRAMSAVRGKKMPDGSVVHFVEKVKFAPPRQPRLNG